MDSTALSLNERDRLLRHIFDKGTGIDPTTLSSEERDRLLRHVFGTYNRLRVGTGIIALAFPFWLWIVGWLYYGLPLQGSMSAYYWAAIEEGGDPPMRVWFVGILFAIGSFLFLYKGYTHWENWALNFAAVCAICVALFPMCWDRWSECPSFSWHGFFAICFFVLLAFVAILHCLYTLGCFQGGSRLLECFRGGWRRLLSGYSGYYVATAAGMVVFPLVTLIMFETNGAQIFLVEFAGIVAFCAFWFVQSAEFFSGIARAWKEGGVSAVVRELR